MSDAEGEQRDGVGNPGAPQQVPGTDPEQEGNPDEDHRVIRRWSLALRLAGVGRGRHFRRRRHYTNTPSRGRAQISLSGRHRAVAPERSEKSQRTDDLALYLAARSIHSGDGSRSRGVAGRYLLHEVAIMLLSMPATDTV
ncbi:hypothetical protein BHE74_00028279 [Ensete ventricosum]|nr:hypothetical protein BHE74_00028279 [Ensete ventricosum]